MRTLDERRALHVYRLAGEGAVFLTQSRGVGVEGLGCIVYRFHMVYRLEVFELEFDFRRGWGHGGNIVEVFSRRQEGQGRLCASVGLGFRGGL